MKLKRFLLKKVFKSVVVADVLVVGFWWVLMLIIWSRMLVFDGEYYWAGWIQVWADWSIHIIYIFNFAYRSLFLKFHPTYLGEPFRYHFGADLMSGVLMKLGLSLVQATIIPSILLSFLLTFLIYYFYLTLFRQRLIAAVASALFFFNGGLGFIWFVFDLLKGERNQGSRLFFFTNVQDAAIHWGNFIVGFIVPQRGFLLGMPLAVLIFLFFWKFYKQNFINISKRLLLLIGILSGLLLSVHVYTYIAVMFVALYLLIVSVLVRKKNLLTWTLFFVPVAVLTILQFIIFFGGIPSGFIQVRPDWFLSGGGGSLLWVWFTNFGVMFILVPLSFFYISKKIVIFSVPFFLLFVLANFVVFQPNIWDNLKFFVYWYFFAAGMVANLLVRFVRQNKLSIQLLVFILFYVSILSGFLDVVNLTRFDVQKFRLFSIDDQEFAKQVRNITEEDSVVLTAPVNSWLAMLMGRQVVMGFTNWLESYGFDVEDRMKDIAAIYQGTDQSFELLNKYDVDYVIVSEQERKWSRVNDEFFNKSFSILIRNDDTVIYDVRRIIDNEV